MLPIEGIDVEESWCRTGADGRRVAWEFLFNDPHEPGSLGWPSMSEGCRYRGLELGVDCPVFPKILENPSRH